MRFPWFCARNPPSDLRPCTWCGHINKPPYVQFCQNCERPLRLIACLIVILKVTLVPLTLALIVGGVVKAIDEAHRETQRSTEERVALVKTYIQLGESIGELRDASMRTRYACRVSEAQCFKTLHATALDVDRIFHDIGLQLSPFAEYADRRKRSTDLIQVWETCFVHPYYSGRFGEAALRRQLHHVLESDLCSSGRCVPDAARAVQSIVSRAWAGDCPERCDVRLKIVSDSKTKEKILAHSVF